MKTTDKILFSFFGFALIGCIALLFVPAVHENPFNIGFGVIEFPGVILVSAGAILSAAILLIGLVNYNRGKKGKKPL